MKFFSFKNKKEKAPEQKKKDCTNDPDCPMCHISQDTLEKLTETEKTH